MIIEAFKYLAMFVVFGMASSLVAKAMSEIIAMTPIFNELILSIIDENKLNILPIIPFLTAFSRLTY